MKTIINFFIQRSFVVNLISVFILLAGLLLGSQLRRDLIPPFEYKQIQVTGNLPGAAATEVEKFLLYPVETALQGLPNTTETRSRAMEGRFRLKIIFPADYDGIDESIEDIQGRLDAIRWKLPEKSRDIFVRQQKVTNVFHLALALANFIDTNPEHRQWATQFSDEVRAIPGIVSVSMGMNPQNIYVNLKPKKLKHHEISIGEVRQKIRQSLSYNPIGKVEYKDQTFTIEVKRPAEAMDSLENLAVRGNRNGNLLRLKDIAQVGLEIDEIKEHSRFNGSPSISAWIQKDTSSDSIDLRDKVFKVIEAYNQKLPAPLKIETVVEGPSFIELQLNTLKGNAKLGFILVILILTLFFNFRVSLVTSFGIPIAYCGTLIALYFMNISIDIISVVGMILVLGILVDDAIIVAERYMENLEKGLSPHEAALAASRDLIIPVTGTVLTTIFAFAPMLLIPSEIATIFYAIPIVIIVSLTMSWLESFFILPNHLKHFIKQSTSISVERGWIATVRRKYRTLLSLILKFRYAMVVGLIAFMALSFWVGKNKIQHNFMFNPDIERIAVKITLHEGVSLEDTEKAIAPIEKYLLSLPKEDIENVTAYIGKMWNRGRRYEGAHYVQFSAHVNKADVHPKATKNKYAKLIGEKLKSFEGPKFKEILVRKEFRGHDEIKSDMVSIDIQGHEDIKYQDIKARLTEITQERTPELELVEDQRTYDKKWLFEPSLEKLARHQLPQSELTRQLRSYFVPDELMQLRMNGETKWVYTQIKRNKDITLEELNRLSVLNSRGLSVPLRTLGQWKQDQQLSQIHHHNGKRQFTFDFAYTPSENMNALIAKEKANELLAPLKKQFPTLQAKTRDADEDEAKRKNWAIKVALLCILLVMFTIALVLNSLTLPWIVGLPIPFGLIGIVWALYLHDLPMGMMSLVGLIGTVGVSVNDSLIMVDQINKRADFRGKMTRDDILDGASSRLRAILLTTITTLGGVFPMAYGIGGESGFTQPLAFSIGWGLFFSTLLTLFALPAFIQVRNDITGLGRRFLRKVWPDKEPLPESKTPPPPKVPISAKPQKHPLPPREKKDYGGELPL